jgi:hypothetical protein
MNKYMACGNTDMLVQKFSSKNAMEKGEKWSGKHIARSGVANTWPEVELSGNNMVLLVVQFVRAFAFFISDASLCLMFQPIPLQVIAYCACFY